MSRPQEGVCSVCGYHGRQYVRGLCVAHDEQAWSHLSPEPGEIVNLADYETVTGGCELCDEEVTDDARHCPPCRDMLEQEYREMTIRW